MAVSDEQKIVLDLNSPTFLKEFLALDKTELAKVARVLKKSIGMEWAVFVKHPGFRWEKIAHIQAPNGRPVYSFRLSQKFRALAQREEDFLRILSLHLDHDSAYQQP